MILEVTGLVTRTVDLSESDRMISLFTAEKGMISAVARGSKNYANRAMAAAQLFCYGRFLLYRRGDKYWVKEAELIESFYAIRQDIVRTALCSYLCDVLNDTATAQPEPELLRLALNCLHAAASGRFQPVQIKAAYEWRAAALLGFMPDVTACRDCGRTEGNFMLYVMDGTIVCDECRASLAEEPEQPGERVVAELLPPGVLHAVRYVLFCPQEKLLSFRLSDDEMHLFARAAETYLTNQLERTFRSLQFYHQVEEL